MRIWIFAQRCVREILRDPINLAFGLGFPCVLLLLLTALQRNIPAELFGIQTLAPGIAVFGLSFMTLFSATLVARDRESDFLQRLYTTPLRASDFILGYMLALMPMALGQGAVTYLLAFVLGLEVRAEVFYALLGLIPMAQFHIALGLLCGSLLGVRQVGGICGGLLTNLCGWLSGVWFDLQLVGGVFERIAYVFPFVHAVQLQRVWCSASTAPVGIHILVTAVYALGTTAAAVYSFLWQMKKQ